MNYCLDKGTVLNSRYEICEVLGSGGYGITYKVNDLETDRVLAIKEYFPAHMVYRDNVTDDVVLYDSVAAEEYDKNITGFLAEARNMARFNDHPNITHVYEFFKMNNTAYYVMEYIDGSSLKEYIDGFKANKQYIDTEDAIRIITDVLNGLETLHSAGIVHRDIKPANIYVGRDGIVRILDFGLARESGKTDSDAIELTQGYAPPEQYYGKAASPRSDIYAVGAVFYEMLTLVRPDAATDRIIEDSLPRPSDINADIPDNISRLIMRALAMNPRIRIRSAAAMKKYLISGTVLNNVHQAEAAAKRRKKAIYILTAVVMAGTLTAVIMLNTIRRKNTIRQGNLDMWLPDNIYSETVIEAILADFGTEYPQITVNTRIIPESGYAQAITEAFAYGNGPDIYDAVRLDNKDEMNRHSLTKLEKRLESGDYNSSLTHYLSEDVLPVVYAVSTIYYNTSKDFAKEEYAQTLNDFLKGTAYMYSGTTDDYGTVQKEMAGQYRISGADDVDEPVIGSGLCINSKSTDNEVRAAEELLYYMTGENAQMELCINSGAGLPVNNIVMETYKTINIEMADIVGGGDN